MKVVILACLVLLPYSVFCQQQTNISYKTYCNDRFGYCIKYPDKLLKPQPEAFNGDGRFFTDKKGDEILAVYGSMNTYLMLDSITPFSRIYELDLKDLKKEAGVTVTYSKLGKSFYVISGTKKDKIFYHKVINREEGFGYALLTYPASDTAIYNEVSGVIFKSFK